MDRLIHVCACIYASMYVCIYVCTLVRLYFQEVTIVFRDRYHSVKLWIVLDSRKRTRKKDARNVTWPRGGAKEVENENDLECISAVYMQVVYTVLISGLFLSYMKADEIIQIESDQFAICIHVWVRFGRFLAVQIFFFSWLFSTCLR